jgi:hypothetical protein
MMTRAQWSTLSFVVFKSGSLAARRPRGIRARALNKTQAAFKNPDFPIYRFS